MWSDFTRVGGIGSEQHVLEVEGGCESFVVADVGVGPGVARAADEDERHILVLVVLPSQIDIVLGLVVFVFIAATATTATAQPTQSRALVLFAICINGTRIFLGNCRLLAVVEHFVAGQPRRQFAAERHFLLHFAPQDIAPWRGIPLCCARRR
jgi:hypothetical protein